jgi:hypothetical protein
LSDSQPTPQPHRAPPRVKPLYLVLGGLGVVVIALVAIVLLTRKSNGGGPGGGGNQFSPTTGVFTFHIDPAQALTTAPTANADKAAKAAKPAAQEVEKLMHDFYVNAYLNTGEWANGAYDGVFDSFSAGAKAQAMHQLNVMTAGASAADNFASIKETSAHLKEKVLMDLNDQPYSVVAVVTFTATATLKDGTTAGLTSLGQYILQKVGSGWQVASYSVTRTAQGSKSSASGGTATPTAVAS